MEGPEGREAADQKNGEEQRQPVEVALNEGLNRGAEEANEAGDQEKAGSAADGGGGEKREQVNSEGAARDGNQLKGNGRETGCEHDPEIMAFIERRHFSHRFRGETRDVAKEKRRRGLPDFVADSISRQSPKDARERA